MQTKINKLPESQIEIDFELSSDEFGKFEERAILEIKRDIEIDGFRKGKAPKDAIIKQIGEEKIISEAANIAIQESFFSFMERSEFEVVSKPEATIIKIAKGNPFQFKIKVSVLPEIILPDYKEIAKTVKKTKIEVKEEEIAETLKWVQKSRAKFSLKESPSEKGDFMEIDYFISGNIEKYNDAFILGEGHFSGGFEEDLIGLKNNEEKKGIKVKDKEGKEILVDVKVIAVKKLDMPKLDDDFAKSLGKFENIEELKKNIREGLSIEKENAEKQKLRNEIIGKISKETKIEIPKELQNKEESLIKEDLIKRVKESLNISFNQYLEKIKKTKEEIEESISQEAQRKIKSILVIREIGKKEEIELTDKEIEEEIENILKHYHDEKEINLNPEELKERVKESLIYEKTLKILENCVE